MKKRISNRRQQAGFSLLELLLVLGVMTILAGLGTGGAKGVRQWLAVNESRSLFMEIRSACQHYRMEHGEWPSSLLGGEVGLNSGEQEWRAQLAPYMDRRVVDRAIEDGFGNAGVYLIIDGDGDHWIERERFEAVDAESLPDRIWARVVLYSVNPGGVLVAASWEDEH
jgi:prepilin-type N-terminal cleavage/methylation domain-containing protein